MINHMINHSLFYYINKILTKKLIILLVCRGSELTVACTISNSNKLCDYHNYYSFTKLQSTILFTPSLKKHALTCFLREVVHTI